MSKLPKGWSVKQAPNDGWWVITYNGANMDARRNEASAIKRAKNLARAAK